MDCPACGETLPAGFRFCGHCGAALDETGPDRSVRKTISVIFCDLKGSTALGETLDSEALREVISRYFDRVRGVIEGHGGAIEKFIGDAVMAVFGLPHQREDDALRAVRCALDMKRALAELNRELASGWGVTLSNRTGVNTGEIVVSDASRGERLLGDAINVAARLEQAAPADDVLIGPDTYRLVRDAVEVEPLEPLTLKGKAEPVPTYRVLAAAGTSAGGDRTRVVGRREELELLQRTLDEAGGDAACRVACLLGDPGVGKSTLIEALGRSRPDALMLRGRCLSYGNGITFWPLLEIVTDAAGISDDDPAEVAKAKLAALAGDDLRVAERIAAALGIGDRQLPLEEIFWGVRKLFEHLASERSLIVVFEDIHWAEATLLDLIEHLADSARGALLIVCEARPELLVVRPEFEQRVGARTLTLEPLGAEDAGELIRLLVEGEIAPEVEARIVSAAAGNPLFVSQLVSMLIDDGALELRDGQWESTVDLAAMELPATLQALLASRLDQLHREEQAVLEPASVAGTIFPDAAVEELVDDSIRPQVALRLSSLAARMLIEEEPDYVIAGDSHRFVHFQVRDAAYRRLLKRQRAALHERFAEWGERLARERGRQVEFQEILGYHLEQAYLYLAELGPLDRHGRELGRRAALQLIPAARRAFARGDAPAAANLLRRATQSLQRADQLRIELLPELAEVLIDAGEFSAAEPYLDEAMERAEDLDDRALAARASLTRLSLESQSGDSRASAERVLTEAREAIPFFEDAADHANLAMAWRLLAWAHGTQGNYEEVTHTAERALEESRIAGDQRQERRAASQFAVAALYGPLPVSEAIRRCEEIIAEASGDRRTEGLVTSLLARLEAMRGDFDRARILYLKARLELEEMGRSVIASSTALDACGVEMLAGDPGAAERELRRDYVALEDMGERYLLSTMAGELARAVAAQGRDAEALALSETAERLSADDDVTSQGIWRLARAKVLAMRGVTDDAMELADEAVALLRSTDATVIRDEGLLDVAEVMELCGERARAVEFIREAVKLLERKGNVVAASAARERIAGLTSPPARDELAPPRQSL
jgi:class 3 adenylate cyclase/tetratricopeptide (TPR) repeat protein